MKIYLVSETWCWSDERMEKHFAAFSNKEDAIRFKDRQVDLIVYNYCDMYDCENNSLDDLVEWVTVTANSPMLFGILSCDGTEEIEIEVTELEVR